MTPDEKRERLDKLAADIGKLPDERIKSLAKLVDTMGKKRVISIYEAAEILACSPDTIRRAIRSGTLKAFQINTAGAWKIPIEELERFMRGDRE